MPNQRIGFITCKPEKLADYFPTAAEPDLLPTEPPFTPDDQLAVNELRRRGHSVAPVIWGGDLRQLRASFDLLVVRSPWDYMDSIAQRQGFFTWIGNLDKTGIPVFNPPAVMAWLTDKRYLLDLERAGVAVVPTTYVAPGSAIQLVDHFQGPMVIKPAISAAGEGLVLLQTEQELKAFQNEFANLNATQGYLLQPLIEEIRTAGEWSLVYFGGQYSHALLKIPAAGLILCHAERGGSLHYTEAPPEIRAAADHLVQQLPHAFQQQMPGRNDTPHFPLLYLRIDVIQSKTGPLISECEGVEPELFFRARPGSESVFADLLCSMDTTPTIR